MAFSDSGLSSVEPEKKPGRSKPGVGGTVIRLAIVFVVMVLLGIYGADVYDNMLDFFKTPGYLIGLVALAALIVVGIVLLVQHRRKKKD